MLNAIQSRVVRIYLLAVLNGEIISPFPDLQRKSRMIKVAEKIRNLNVFDCMLILNRESAGDLKWIYDMAENFCLKFNFFPRMFSSLAIYDLREYLNAEKNVLPTFSVFKGLHSIATKITSGQLPLFYDIKSTPTENALIRGVLMEIKKSNTTEEIRHAIQSTPHIRTLKRQFNLAFEEGILYFAVPGSVNLHKNRDEFNKNFRPKINPSTPEFNRKNYEIKRARVVY
jgi:hypothetical protein